MPACRMCMFKSSSLLPALHSLLSHLPSRPPASCIPFSYLDFYRLRKYEVIRSVYCKQNCWSHKTTQPYFLHRETGNGKVSGYKMRWASELRRLSKTKTEAAAKETPLAMTLGTMDGKTTSAADQPSVTIIQQVVMLYWMVFTSIIFCFTSLRLDLHRLAVYMTFFPNDETQILFSGFDDTPPTLYHGLELIK